MRVSDPARLFRRNCPCVRRLVGLTNFQDLLTVEVRPLVNAAIIGASGGIGGALASRLEQSGDYARVLRFSRRPGVDSESIDILDEASIMAAAAAAESAVDRLDLILVATGRLQDACWSVLPEKSWRALDAGALQAMFAVNTIGPALVAKHFLPLLRRGTRGVFAALSARVGSIEDNHLGGWYGYRASKAALNMMVRTLAIELSRRNPDAVCVALHPGTVDTPLSAPFQRGVRPEKLFAPETAAEHLLRVIAELSPADSGKLLAWDGSAVPF